MHLLNERRVKESDYVWLKGDVAYGSPAQALRYILLISILSNDQVKIPVGITIAI